MEGGVLVRHEEEFGKCPHVRTRIDEDGVPFCVDCQSRLCPNICVEKCWVLTHNTQPSILTLMEGGRSH